MEASALQAPAALAHRRVSIGLPWLRLRSDDQLVALFRAGNDEAFSVIHDRYRQRLFAYTRQMLPGSRQDAEDALQDVFVRAYGGLRASDRELALRAWLYRVAHNRCIDELRRPPLPSPELLEANRPPTADPLVIAEQRDTLRRLIADVRRLPEQQRSALLMRELSDMSYAELAHALDVSLPAVKSLLVRARIGLARAADARDAACSEIREELTVAHDRGVRPNSCARRHLKDCAGCREFRRDVRGLRRQLAALTPVIGPVGALAKLVGFGFGGGASSSAAGGVAVAGGAGGAVTAGGLLAGSATHIATLLAAAVITAGGAVELQNTLITPAGHHRDHHAARVAKPSSAPAAPITSAPAVSGATGAATATPAAPAAPAQAGAPATAPARPRGAKIAVDTKTPSDAAGAAGQSAALFDMTAPPSAYGTPSSTAGTTGTGSSATTGAGVATGSSTGAGASTTGTGSPTTGSGSGTLGGTSTGTGTGATGTASGTTGSTGTPPGTSPSPGTGTGGTTSGGGTTATGTGSSGSGTGSGSGSGISGGALLPL